MNFCLQLFFLASLCFRFQVPRKVVFCHHRGNEQPLNPPKQMKLKTHRTHQPVSAPCTPLVCSPWKPLGKGCQPPTTSTTVLWHACLCAHQGELSFSLCCSHQESDELLAKNTATRRKALVSVHVPLIWFQSEVRFGLQKISVQKCHFFQLCQWELALGNSDNFADNLAKKSKKSKKFQSLLCC